MSEQFPGIDARRRTFIEAQPLFFVGTAAIGGRVNVSPKGLDSLRVLGSNRVVWLNLTGSGNETAAHLLDNPRMTVMFCSFAREPLIVRLYGTAETIHPGEPGWDRLFALFEPHPGARQIFDFTVDLVQTSCGYAVPYLSFEAERPMLNDWSTKKGPSGIGEYWQAKNVVSIDGFLTGMPPSSSEPPDPLDHLP